MSARKRKSTSALYEIDHIVSKRIRKGEREFLIRWKGYGEDSDSWEPETNIKPEVVQNFLIDDEKFKAAPRTTRTGSRKSESGIPATTLTPAKPKRARSQKSDATSDTPSKTRRTRTPSRTRVASRSPVRRVTSTSTSSTTTSSSIAEQGTLLSPSRGTTRVASAKKSRAVAEEPRDYARPSLLHSRPTATTRTYERTTVTTSRSPATTTSNDDRYKTSSTPSTAKFINQTPSNSAIISTPTPTSPLQVHAGMLVPSLLVSATLATLIHLVLGVSLSPGVAKTVLAQLEKLASHSISNAILERIHLRDYKLLIAIIFTLYILMHLITRLRTRALYSTDYTVGVVTTQGIPDTHWTSPKYNHRADRWSSEMIRAIFGFITIVAVVLFWKKEPSWATKQHMEPAFFAITASFAIIDLLINHPTMRAPRIIHSLITAGITSYLVVKESSVDPILYQHLFYAFILIVLAEAERAGSVSFGGLLHPMTSYIYQILYILGTPILGALFYIYPDNKHPVEASIATGVLVTQAFTSIIDQYVTQQQTQVKAK